MAVRGSNTSQASAHMRVLHGFAGAAGQPTTIAAAQRSLGADASAALVGPDKFGYGADVHIPLARDRFTDYASFLGQAAGRFDVFHFYARPLFSFEPGVLAFPTGLDLLLLRAAGKTVVFHYRGSEIRTADEFRRASPHHYVDDDPDGLFDLFPTKAVRSLDAFIKGVANAVLVPDEELQTYSPGSRIVRRAVDLERLRAAPPLRRPTGTLRVVHAPTRRTTKGTDSVIRATEALRAQGFTVELDLLEGRTTAEVADAIRRSHVVIDQLRIGWYGVLAAEAMALGRPVVAFIRDDLISHLGPSSPILVATPSNLADQLERAITQPEILQSLAGKARPFAETHHDARAIGRGLLDLYADPTVRSAPVDIDAACEFLVTQREHTMMAFGRSRRGAPHGTAERLPLLERFRLTRERDGMRVAMSRTLKWAARQAR